MSPRSTDPRRVGTEAETAGDRATAAVGVQLRAERTFAELQDVLAGVGVDVLVLKGPHLGNTVYLDPLHRNYSDLDVLVRPSQFLLAVETLAASGFWRQPPDRGRLHSARYDYSEHLSSRLGISVDLHRDFASYDRYPVDIDAMFARSVKFPFGGVLARGLGTIDLLLALILHIVHAYFQVEAKHFRDLATVVAHEPVDWGEFCSRIEAARCSRGAYYALAAAIARHGASVPTSVLERLEPGIVWKSCLSLVLDPRNFPMLRRPMHRGMVQMLLALPMMDRVRDWPHVAFRYAGLRLRDGWVRYRERRIP